MLESVTKVAKRPKSSYIHYSNDKTIRDKVKTDHPEWSVTKVASFLGQQWKSMESTEKQKWVDLYLKEKEELKNNPVYVTKKKKKNALVDSKTLDKRIDDLERVVNQLQNEVISLKHQLIN